jgi:hypothetical protein
LQNVVDGLGDGQRPVLLHEDRKVLPLDVLHHQKMPAVRFVRVVRGDDVGVLQGVPRCPT